MGILKAILYMWLFYTTMAALFLVSRVALAALFRVPGWVEGPAWEKYRSLAFEYHTAVYRPGYGPPVKQVDQQTVLFPFLPASTQEYWNKRFWRCLIILCLISGLGNTFPVVGLIFWFTIYSCGGFICWKKTISQWKTLRSHPELSQRLKAVARLEIAWTALWTLLFLSLLGTVLFTRLPNVL